MRQSIFLPYFAENKSCLNVFYKSLKVSNADVLFCKLEALPCGVLLLISTYFEREEDRVTGWDQTQLFCYLPRQTFVVIT